MKTSKQYLTGLDRNSAILAVAIAILCLLFKNSWTPDVSFQTTHQFDHSWRYTAHLRGMHALSRPAPVNVSICGSLNCIFIRLCWIYCWSQRGIIFKYLSFELEGSKYSRSKFSTSVRNFQCFPSSRYFSFPVTCVGLYDLYQRHDNWTGEMFWIFTKSLTTIIAFFNAVSISIFSLAKSLANHGQCWICFYTYPILSTSRR